MLITLLEMSLEQSISAKNQLMSTSNVWWSKTHSVKSSKIQSTARVISKWARKVLLIILPLSSKRVSISTKPCSTRNHRIKTKLGFHCTQTLLKTSTRSTTVRIFTNKTRESLTSMIATSTMWPDLISIALTPISWTCLRQMQGPPSGPFCRNKTGQSWLLEVKKPCSNQYQPNTSYRP